MMKPNKFNLFFLVPFLGYVFIFNPLWAGQKNGHGPMDNQFGGHLKLEGGITGYDSQSYFETVGTGTGLDGAASTRLTDKLVFSDTFYVEAHYEAGVKFGDTYKKRVDLQNKFPSLPGGLISRVSNMDNHRLFDLTKTIRETEDYLLWHRLDRLFFSARTSRGDIMVGRQAVTWGNGLIFNPMNLFSPFSPADIVRDYKMGEDLVSVRLNTERIEEINLLVVPRRDTTTGEVEASSVAGKLHFFAGDMEMDIMGARHYNETVLGLGGTGYLGDAAWRCDMIWSSLENTVDKSGYIEVVANIDYSWGWFDKNMYGLIEYYHNGLGKDKYTHAMSESALIERIDRGELFALGRHYINARIQVEIHPLLNLYLNSINNIKDPSGMLQPWLSFSMTRNATLLLGANFFYGSRESEYGGFLIPGTPYYTNAGASGYLLFTWYF